MSTKMKEPAGKVLSTTGREERRIETKRCQLPLDTKLGYRKII